MFRELEIGDAFWIPNPRISVGLDRAIKVDTRTAFILTGTFKMSLQEIELDFKVIKCGRVGCNHGGYSYTY